MNIGNNLKREWLQFLLLIIPFPLIAIYWNQFPERIPFHWNIQGEVDDYANKAFGLFFGPCINIIMYILFLVLPRLDPRGANYRLFQGSYKVLRLSITGFLLFIFLLVFLSSLGHQLDIGRLVIYFTLILFLVIGNMLGTFRSNWFVGFRTPWTIEHPDVWFRTHRLAGKLWVAATLVMLALGFFIPFGLFIILYFIYIGAITIVPFIYSYIIYKKLLSEKTV